jgi:phytanoyl-CoA hydroxylase
MIAISKTQTKFYQDHGWLVLRKFYNPSSDFKEFYFEISSLLDYISASPVGDSSSSVIASRILELASSNRAALGALYRSLRHLPSLQNLLVDRKAKALCSQLIPDLGILNICPYTATRIDIKGEEQYLFDWHQDYHYIQLSEDSVVIWFPFLPLDSTGAVEILDRSHLNGIRRARMLDTLSIIEDIDFTCYETVSPVLDVGDILVFSTLTIHRSKPQCTYPLRLTSQFRYGNFAHRNAISRGWPVGQLEGRPFHLDHPDLVIQ